MQRARGTHVVFSTGCTPYFDWQALGLAYSLLHSQWPADTQLTRLMSACADPVARARSTNLPHMAQRSGTFSRASLGRAARCDRLVCEKI